MRRFERFSTVFAFVVVFCSLAYLAWQLGRHFGYREALEGGKSCRVCHHTVEVLDRQEAEKQAEALRRAGFRVEWDVRDEKM